MEACATLASPVESMMVIQHLQKEENGDPEIAFLTVSLSSMDIKNNI